MNDNQVSHTARPFTEYFNISYKISETFGATLYSAIIIASSKPTVIWVAKFPVDLKSDQAKDLLAHINKIDSIEPAIGPFDTYGIDSNGIAFISFTEKVSANLVHPRGSSEEMERRLFKTVRAVHSIHEAGQFLGNLNSNSFWLNNSGGVDLTAVLKFPVSYNADDLRGYDPKLIPFLAPEIFTGKPTFQSDIYSLGMIAFDLILNRLPVEVRINAEGHPRITSQLDSKMRSQMPPFLLEVLEKAISVNPENRYGSSGEFLEALVAANERSKLGDRRESIVAGNAVNVLPALFNREREVEKYAEPLKSRFSRNSLIIILFSSLISIVLAIFLSFYFYSSYREGLAKKIYESTAPYSGGNPELSRSIAEIANLSGELKDKIIEIQALAESPDFLSYGLLVASTQNTQEILVIQHAQAAIVYRLQQAGFSLAAAQLSDWFRYSSQSPQSPTYQLVIKLLDPAMPIDEKITSLRELNEQDLNISILLATALFFDLEQKAEFKDLFEEQISKSITIANIEDFSSLAILMHHEVLQNIFTPQIRASYDRLTNQDLPLLLKMLAKGNQEIFNDLINIAIEREILPKLQANFLKVIQDNKLVDLEINAAFVDAALGNLNQSAIGRIISWHSPRLEEVVFPLILMLEDPDQQLLVLDSFLSKRQFSSPLVIGVLDWLRENRWDQRQKYLKSLAVLASSLDYEEPDLVKALETFKRHLKNKTLHTAFAYSNDERLVWILLKDFNEQVGLSQKIKLLNHSDMKIRKLAIETLETNDVGAMKLIIASYQKEKEPELRLLYEQRYWFVRERL